ncbi:MAG: hypothetical protein ACK4NS_02695 [Saprospiraceae bacterium]
MKKLLLALITLAASLPALAQIDTVRMGKNSFRFRSASTIVPAPLPGFPHPPNPAPHFTYFWMTSDGQFSQRDTAVLGFSRNKSGDVVQIKKKERSRYSATEEPNPSRISVPIYSDSGIVISPISNTPAFFCRAVPEATAARLGDSVYIALQVRNETELKVSGNMNFFFPLDAFVDQSNPHFVFNVPDYSTSAEPKGISYIGSAISEVGLREGRVFRFSIKDIDPFSEKAIFFVIRFKGVGDLRDSSTHQLFVDWDLNRVHKNLIPDNPKQNNSGDLSSNQGPSVNKNNQENGAENAYFPFTALDTVNIALSKGRDPNALSVAPKRHYASAYMPPSQRGKPIPMEFTLDTENLGSAVVSHLRTTTYFDPRIDMGATSVVESLSQSCENRPSTPGSSPCDYSFVKNAQQANWNVQNILLAPRSAEASFRQARVVMRAQTKDNLYFAPGDKIQSQSLIKFLNRSGIVEDSVWTNYAVTEFVKPAKARYGLTAGVKLHHSTDAATLTRGANLTLRLPLDLRRNPWERTAGTQPLPRWYWQLEAGAGQSKCPLSQDPNAALSYNFVHLSPANLRYFHPVNLAQWFRYVGFTAGYSADLIIGTLPSGTSSRSVHELALSLDFSNRINVPAFTLGAGYKTRFGQDLSTCNMPFVYLQTDFARFRKGFSKVWNTVRYR